MGKKLRFHYFFLIAAFINLVFFGDCKADNSPVAASITIDYYDGANSIYDLSYLVETFFENVLDKDIPLPVDSEYHVNKFEFKGKRISRHLPKIEDLNKQVELHKYQWIATHPINTLVENNHPPTNFTSALQTGELSCIYRFSLF